MNFNTIDTTTVKLKGFKYIPAGIQDNVTIQDITYGQTPFGVNYIEVKYEKDGMTSTTTEREASQGTLTDDQFKEKLINQLARIERIAGAIQGVANPKPVEELGNGESQMLNPRFREAGTDGTFEDVFKWLYNIWKSKPIDQKYRIKFVYPEGSKYVTTPKYVAWEWIEPMFLVEEDRSKITKLNFDLYRPQVVQADTESKVDNALEEAAQNANATDGLPF